MVVSFDRNAGHVQTVHIVRVPYSSGISIFRGINNHPHGNSPLEGVYHGVGLWRIRNTKHVDIELHLLCIDGVNRALPVIVRRDCGRRKIQLRI